MNIHCQHVLQAVVWLHQKTQHIVEALAFGRARWSVSDILRGPREALTALVAALQTNVDVCLHAYALVQGTSAPPRYVTLTKSYHLVHFSPASDGQRVRCWPKRTTQIFESIFLSREHVIYCLEAEETTVPDPLSSWRARKRSELLRERVHAAHRGGRILPACRALLLRSFMDGSHKPILPSVSRLIRSTAAQLASLSNLNRTIQGIVGCSQSEENRIKCDQKALAGMFHAYRIPTLDYLASDSCCNFEAMRSTVQAAFYDVLTDLRQQGILTQDSRLVLETVDDYMHCNEVAVAHQLVANDSKLLDQLRACAPPK